MRRALPICRASPWSGAARPILLPGDRPMDIGAMGYRQQRPREPGSAVDARMSMRLDTGPRTNPDFGLGGIGGALLRMTDALIDR